MQRCIFILLLWLPGFLNAQTFRLFHTTRTAGTLQELDLTTGNVLGSNLGGITNGRGMAFSPLGGLFITNNNQVSRLDSSNGLATTVLTFTGETPYDIDFDPFGMMYVVTNLNVHVVSPPSTTVLTFPHNMAGSTGDGNSNKPWGIAVRPDNGEIYVVGGPGMRRFNPSTGAQIGTTIAGSANGFAGIALTGSSFGGVCVYIGNIISGVDQLRAFDCNLNLLRQFWPPHNGNPIDVEVHPLNDDIYIFSTVTSNPANRYLLNETAAPGFSTANRPSQGSALGAFEGIILSAGRLAVDGQIAGEQVRLAWHIPADLSAERFRIGSVDAGAPTRWQVHVPAVARQTRYTEELGPAPDGPQQYIVQALDADGAVVAEGRWHMASPASDFSFAYQVDRWSITPPDGSHAVEWSLFHLDGRLLRHQRTNGERFGCSTLGLPKGVYGLRATAWDATGRPLGHAYRLLYHQP